MSRVLVLGADGFLGRHVCAAFAADPTVALLMAGRVPNPADAEGEGEAWYRLDLVDPAPLRRLLAVEHPDVIVNCAGRTAGSSADLVRANLDLVASVVSAVHAVGSDARFVHLGSAAEYGAGEPGVPFDEATPAKPLSEYGRLKHQASELVLGADLDSVVLRVFNPVGPGAPPTSLVGHAIELLRSALASRSPSVLMGPLGAHRDFIHVGDVADGVVAAASTAEARGRIVNIGSGQARQAREIVRGLASVAGFGGDILEEDAPSSRSSAIDWQQADVRLAERLLGWTATRTIEDALDQAWKAANAGAS